MPSTSTFLFPDLMTRDELISILKYKFRRIGVNTGKINKLTDDELLKKFKKIAMPKPQRKVPSFFVISSSHFTFCSSSMMFLIVKAESEKYSFIEGTGSKTRKLISYISFEIEIISSVFHPEFLFLLNSYAIILNMNRLIVQ